MVEKVFISGLCSLNTTAVAVNEKGTLEEILTSGYSSKSTRSNIYLGTIVRVEHSLQAAFVDYGSDKNGFLPFSDIHPDYYRLPHEDKELIKKEITAKHRESEENDSDSDSDDEQSESSTIVKQDVYKKYNIQEVIKRGQNILVQVYKDGRGNKGASLTTYISLPGRYSVFMPNTLHGSGISRKIADQSERQRIMNIIKDFNLAPGTGIVVRTAGECVSSEDLLKDTEYLIKLWNKIRNKTLESKAMSLIYSENGIVKQAIRDMCLKSTKSIIVQGDEIYKEVLETVTDISPKDISKVVQYNENIPLFVKFGIEKQIQNLLKERVELPSGGSIVIQTTEALTSVDVNSGKATAEKNVEDMALKINIEAAYEIARQLKLRDIGGLIVVDFIDMLDISNRKTVERTLKSAFYNDRAKVQFSRISIFGLLELSRQRIRSSIAELYAIPCEICGGSGFIKSAEVVINNLLSDIDLFLLENNSYKKYTIHCSSQNISIINGSYKDIITKFENKKKIKLKFVEDPKMVVDQYKVIAEAEDGTTIVVKNHKGTPLSLYFYDQKINDNNQGVVSFDDNGRNWKDYDKSKYHEDKKGVLGNKRKEDVQKNTHRLHSKYFENKPISIIAKIFRFFSGVSSYIEKKDTNANTRSDQYIKNNNNNRAGGHYKKRYHKKGNSSFIKKD